MKCCGRRSLACLCYFICHVLALHCRSSHHNIFNVTDVLYSVFVDYWPLFKMDSGKTLSGAGQPLSFLSSFQPAHQIFAQPIEACEGGGSHHCFSFPRACAPLLMEQVGSVRFVACTPRLWGFSVLKQTGKDISTGPYS